MEQFTYFKSGITLSGIPMKAYLIPHTRCKALIVVSGKFSRSGAISFTYSSLKVLFSVSSWTKQKFTWISGRICNWEKRISFFPFLKLFYTFLLSFITKQDVVDSSVIQTRKLISNNICVLMIATWRQSERSVILLGFCCRLFIVFRTLCNFWRANKVSVSCSCSLTL
jgi:hypothetical protein